MCMKKTFKQIPAENQASFRMFFLLLQLYEVDTGVCFITLGLKCIANHLNRSIISIFNYWLLSLKDLFG